MKILLINNRTMHLGSLLPTLAGHQVEVQTYRPGLDFHDADKDLIILSGGGGEGLEIHDEHQPGKLWYEDEMEFIRTTDKNIVGICMGFEVIARAYGAPVTNAGRLILDRQELQVSKAGLTLSGSRHISQYEAHSWRVEDVPAGFEVLVTSKTGIEMFAFDDKEHDKKVIAAQFHPEKGGTLTLENLIQNYA
jgi:GMP synthase-like glutamine amidotransferase